MAEGERARGKPPFKKAKLKMSKSKSKLQHFQRVQKKLLRHRDFMCEALEELNSDWACFCFVKIKYCNAHQPGSFSEAYCETVRNVQEMDADKRHVVWIPDLFHVSLVQNFIDVNDNEENPILDKHLTALEKLADFLDNISETNKILDKQLKDEAMKEAQWATLFGTHVLRKIAVFDEMKIDSDYFHSPKECPCGCKAPINFADNSMGHQDAWHGSVDILLGPVAVSATKSEDEKEIARKSKSEFELEREELDYSQNHLIPESITFAFAMRGGVVPLIGISKRSFKVYMYDPDNDLLYESTTMPLFLMSVKGRKLYSTSLVVLWLIINHSHFFTGVRSSHVEFGYKANLKNFLEEDQREIYEHHIRLGGLRKVTKSTVEFIAGMNVGMFKRL